MKDKCFEYEDLIKSIGLLDKDNTELIYRVDSEGLTYKLLEDLNGCVVSTCECLINSTYLTCLLIAMRNGWLYVWRDLSKPDIWISNGVIYPPYYFNIFDQVIKEPKESAKRVITYGLINEEEIDKVRLLLEHRERNPVTFIWWEGYVQSPDCLYVGESL